MNPKIAEVVADLYKETLIYATSENASKVNLQVFIDRLQAIAAVVYEAMGEVRDSKVVWFDQNPHAYPEGTKFYAQPIAVVVDEAMVLRACIAYAPGHNAVSPHEMIFMRAALTAALSASEVGNE